MGVLTLMALAPVGSAGQLLDDRLLPAGVVRVSAWPAFSTWDARFGDTSGTSSGRIALGSVLEKPDALALFPGNEAWAEDLRALSGNPGYTPVLGPTTGRVTQDVTRIDLGLDVGITAWWSVGVTVPRAKNRTAVSLVFSPDTIASDLGVSPAVEQSGAVDAFVLELGNRATSARLWADGLCDAQDAGCAAARTLADEVELLADRFGAAYASMPFFPLAESAIGAALEARVASVDADLQAAGFQALTAPLVLGEARPSETDLASLPTRFSALGYAAPLGSQTPLWGVGDLEVRTLLRLLRLGDRGGEVPPWTVDILGGAVVRLGTGSAPDPDIPLALGTGDGQTDVEIRLAGHGTVGGRLSVRAGGLYGWQASRTLVRRVPGEDALLVPAVNRVVGEWRPGNYWGVEIEPGLLLARELTLSGSYRMWRRGADAFVPEAGSALAGRGASSHALGAGLEYDVSASGATGVPMRLRLRWLRTVTGGGGAPAMTRVELAAELFRRIWGGR
jgi:hypothetical protein